MFRCNCLLCLYNLSANIKRKYTPEVLDLKKWFIFYFRREVLEESTQNFLEWPKEHQHWRQSEGTWHSFNVSGERLRNNLIAANLRKCHKIDGVGVFWEGTDRIKKDRDHKFLGRLATRRKGDGASLEGVVQRAVEISLLSLSWLWAAKFHKPPVWYFSQTDFKQLVLDGFQGSLPANTSMILVFICELLLYIFLIFEMCKARMSKLFRCLTSAELSGRYRGFYF